jgi:hypothetical protein
VSITFAKSKPIFSHTKTIPANLATLSFAPMLWLAVLADIPQATCTTPTAMLMHPLLTIPALILLLALHEILTTRLALVVVRSRLQNLAAQELRCHVE